MYTKKKLRSGCPPSMMAKHEASPPPDPRILSEIKIIKKCYLTSPKRVVYTPSANNLMDSEVEMDLEEK